MSRSGDEPLLLDQFERWVRAERIPLTRQRRDIASVLVESRAQMSVDEVRDALQARGSAAGLATIYRTLDLMVRAGVARSREFGEGFRRYEAVGAGAIDTHLVCRHCGMVRRITDERMQRIIPILADEHAFRLEDQRIELYGACAECGRRELESFTQ